MSTWGSSSARGSSNRTLPASRSKRLSIQKRLSLSLTPKRPGVTPGKRTSFLSRHRPSNSGRKAHSAKAHSARSHKGVERKGSFADHLGLHHRNNPEPKPLEVGDPVQVHSGQFQGKAGYILALQDEDNDIKLDFGEDWDFVQLSHIKPVPPKRDSIDSSGMHIPEDIPEDGEILEEEPIQLTYDVSHEPMTLKRFFKTLVEPLSTIKDQFFADDDYEIEGHLLHVQLGKSAFKGDGATMLTPFLTGDSVREGSRVKMCFGNKHLWMEGKVTQAIETEAGEKCAVGFEQRVKVMFEGEEEQRIFAALGADLELFDSIAHGDLCKEQYFVCDDGSGALPVLEEHRRFKATVRPVAAGPNKTHKFLLRIRSPHAPHDPIDIEAEVNPLSKHHKTCPQFRLVQTTDPVSKDVLVGQPVFLSGPAARGKSTFLRQFAHEIVATNMETKQYNQIPLVVPAAGLANAIEQNEMGPDDNILDAFIGAQYSSREASLLFQMHQQKRLIVLLDNMDIGLMDLQVGQIMTAYASCKLLTEVCLCVTGRYPLNPFDMSVPPSKTFDMFRRFFLPVNAVPLSREMQEQMVEDRFDDVELERWDTATELATFIDVIMTGPSSESFVELTGNPLYLNLLISEYIGHFQERLVTLKDLEDEEDMLMDVNLRHLVNENASTVNGVSARDQKVVLPRARAKIFQSLFSGMIRFHRHEHKLPIQQATRFMLHLGYALHTLPDSQFRLFDDDFLEERVFFVDESSESDDDYIDPYDTTPPKLRRVWDKHLKTLIHEKKFPLIVSETDGEKDLYRICTLSFQEYLCSAYVVNEILEEEEEAVGKRRKWIGDKIPELPMMHTFVKVCQPDGNIETLISSPRYQVVVQMCWETLPRNTAAAFSRCFLRANNTGAVPIKKNLKSTSNVATLCGLVSCLNTKIILDLSNSDLTTEGINGLFRAVNQWGVPLPMVNELDMSKNKLGLFSPTSLLDFAPCTRLQVLNFNDCQLTGPFSDYLYKMLFNLQYYDFKGNHFDVDPRTLIGVFINEYTNIKDQAKLLLSGRKLIGPMPSFKTCRKLQELDLSMNRLTGEIPSFEGCNNLQSVFLAGNKLVGNIPSFNFNKNLKRLDISGNSCNGLIPSFTACTRLQKIELQRNELEGGVPDVSTCSELKVLWAKDNKLSGTLPLWLIRKKAQGCNVTLSGNAGFNLPNNVADLEDDLTQLDLRDCSLIGKLPTFGMKLLLKEVWLGGNKFDEQRRNSVMDKTLANMHDTLPACGWLDITSKSGDPELRKHALRTLRSNLADDSDDSDSDGDTDLF